MLKLRPFEEFVGDDPVINYVGLRADENRGGYISHKPNIKAVLPFPGGRPETGGHQRDPPQFWCRAPALYTMGEDTIRVFLLLLPAEDRVGAAEGGTSGSLRAGQGLRKAL